MKSGAVRFLPVILACSLIGGILTWSVARSHVGPGVSFWPYFKDGLVLGALTGAVTAISRSPAIRIIMGLLLLAACGFLYHFLVIAMMSV
ncbi:hypothetical protein OVA24_14075 [Luteolibacter sp. SL250]|uniref:hypothetical protein n=1 Tax=Luteolibacter sp. SL250 TaxID=2995170 RepID=UPI00226F1525|nr:hypothetical protein [Luteolibacter sp. SL250]WAC18361.1 hypothetical protein OVA24_14075 [Luteolibacter sp. SL250]